MRLVIVIPFSTNRSGIEIATSRLAIQLKRMGHFVEIVEKGKNHSINNFEIKGLQDINDIERYLFDTHDNYDVLHWAGLFETDNEISKQILISEKLYYNYKKRVSFLLERTGTSTPFTSEIPYERLVKIMPKMATPNLYQKEQIEELLNTSGVVVLPTGVNTEDEFYPITQFEKKSRRKKLEIPEQAVIGVYAGRFVPRKGLDLLLDAWAGVNKNNNVLILIGSGFDDPQSTEDKVRRTAKELGNVIIVPYTDQLDRSYYYALSDFAVFAGRQEGEPTALVESMSCGLPVIASNIPGYTELITPNSTGLLFEPENKLQLIESLNLIISSPKIRETLGNNARKIAVNSRDIKTIANKFISLIEQV